jgi:hypothetical protein
LEYGMRNTPRFSRKGSDLLIVGHPTRRLQQSPARGVQTCKRARDWTEQP